MVNEQLLDETLDDVLNSGYNLPKSRTNKVLSNMKRIFLGTILGSGLILGINYYNHHKLKSDFRYEIKNEIFNLVNKSISNEDIRNYVYDKIDSYLEENPNLISKTYKNSIDSLVNYFINEISEELKNYSDLRLNQNLLKNSNNNISISERIEPIINNDNTASTSKRIEPITNNYNIVSCSERIENNKKNIRIFFDNRGNSYLTRKLSLEKQIIRPIFDDQRRTYIVFDNTYERISNNNSNLISDYKKIERKYGEVDIVFYAYFNEKENRTLIYDNHHEYIRTIIGNNYTYEDLIKN